MVTVEKEKDSASLQKRSQLQPKHLKAQDVFWRTQRLWAVTSLRLQAAEESSWTATHRSSAQPGYHSPDIHKHVLYCPRCEENPFCKWFTYDDRKGLCYLKDRRGFLADSRSRFTSGATFRDGCAPDPPCERPYTRHPRQCLFSAPAPGSRDQAGALCERLGGHLVTTYDAWSGPGGEDWHWVDARGGAGCWACRPAHWAEGVTRLPCAKALAFSCHRNTLFPAPLPPSPLINNDIDITPDLGEIISNEIETRGFVLKKRLRNLRRRRKLRRRQRYSANPFLDLAFYG